MARKKISPPKKPTPKPKRKQSHADTDAVAVVRGGRRRDTQRPGQSPVVDRGPAPDDRSIGGNVPSQADLTEPFQSHSERMNAPAKAKF
jgi:hypothetical protein